jgi:hypothetical protein
MNERLEADWDVDEPSPEFAGRVVAAAQSESRPRSMRRYAIGAAVAAAVAATALLVAWPRRGNGHAHGDVTAAERIEVSIGERAVAVLEPGAQVRWQGDRVEQVRGDVFYRVEPGATFTVKTRAADAQVLGTCFRISIQQETEMKRRDVAAGAIGAVAAAVVIVGVYEGKVRVSHAEQSVTVRAGESAVADGKSVRAGGTIASVAKPAEATGNARSEAQLRARLAELEREQELLSSELTAAYDAVGKSAYDLTPEDWAKMAERGEFKYQYPCFRKGGFRPTEEQLHKLGLPPEAADTIQKAYANSNERFSTEMRAICTEAMGKPGADGDLSSCLQKLFQTIYTSPGGAKATFKHVAEIRAGKLTPADARTPEMKMLLAFSGGMAPFEAELAKAFGAEEAHRLAYSDDLCFQAQSL